ncbi:MAG: hypothetical protein A3K03_09175 [Bdellovibrionales bacterium RIFOXYD1_FULL_44_7]|nr:MAG: hypothetical protein A3K03_09175 [Bdellovibrionales bacterium RIFOXYD1_FULL_44_7]
MKRRIYFLLVSTVCAITVLFTSDTKITANMSERMFSESSPQVDYDVLGKFRNTYYYSALESEYQELAIDDEILDMQDRVLAKVSRKFRRAVDIEGTGKLIDGRVINYAGVKNKRIRYRVTENIYGDGVGSCALVPFHTVAVDRTKIALGSVVYIDETYNMLLPDGTRHNGLWKAEDVGGAIKRDRIDLFVGEGDQGEVLEAAGIGHLEALTVRLVSPPSQDTCTRLPETAEPIPAQWPLQNP